jgi:hypothetical protein
MQIDDLHKIKRVETPPFLFTRIQQRIDQARMMPKKAEWALAVSFALILAMNIGILFRFNKPKAGVEGIAQTMDLFSHNTLYR